MARSARAPGAGVIASVRGPVLSIGPTSAVVEVGGVGLEVACTPATLAGLRTGETATLATALVVREDSLALYGFRDADERALFDALQSASGVGPRLAQAVLAVHSPHAVRRAVAAEDVAALMLVPGIGRKGAQRLVLELKDRLGAPQEGTSTAAPERGAPVTEQVRSALLELGYSARETDDALAALAFDLPEDPAVRLRAALSALRRR
jgi:Holliday junction DNA helicase RuvA